MPAYTHMVFSRASGSCQLNAYCADIPPAVPVETRIFYNEWS